MAVETSKRLNLHTLSVTVGTGLSSSGAPPESDGLKRVQGNLDDAPLAAAIDAHSFRPPPSSVASDLIDAADYGVSPDNMDNTEALQRVIDMARDGGRVKNVQVRLPEGTLRTHGTVGIDASTDIDVGLHLFGAASRGTQIVKKSGDGPVFRFSTTSGNLRGITLESIAIANQGGDGLVLDRVGYNLFRNLTFQTIIGGTGLVLTGGSVKNRFQTCWWVHNANGQSVRVDGGRGMFNACQFGEETGLIEASAGGYVWLDNCEITNGVLDRLTEVGPYGLGRPTLYCGPNAWLRVSSCVFNNLHSDVVAAIARPKRFTMTDCDVILSDGTDLIVQEHASIGSYGPINVRHNEIEFLGDGELYRHTASSARNSTWAYNTITNGPQLPASLTEEASNITAPNVWRSTP